MSVDGIRKVIENLDLSRDNARTILQLEIIRVACLLRDEYNARAWTRENARSVTLMDQLIHQLCAAVDAMDKQE